MFNFSKKLEKIYFFLLIVILFAVVGVTHVIGGDLNIREHILIREEYLESFFILTMLLIAYFIFNSYRREIEKNKEHLEEAFKYIGQINVQLQEIEDAFSKIEKVPENKKELKHLIDYLANKALSIINVEWVLVRIVGFENARTLKEGIKSRGPAVLLKHEISNGDLIEQREIKGITYISSKQKNLGIKAYFIFPAEKINEKQKILIKALANQLEMIFIIYNSKYFN